MLGIQCTESSIRAAAAKKSGQLLSVSARAEQKLGKDVISGGNVQDEEKTLEALMGLKKSLKMKSGKVTLCLSPQVVYTVLLRLPKVRSGRLAAAVRKELEAILPEDIEDLHIQFTPLRQDQKGTRVAVTAVRKDLLSTYQTILKQAKLSLGNITTTALALGDMLKHVDTFMLANIEDPEPSIVVFIGGHPVDEQLLDSVSAASVQSALTSLINAYNEDGMPVQHISIHGTKELFKKIEDSFTPKKVAKNKKEEMKEVVTVEHVLPSLSKTDLSWGGIIASSLGKGFDVRSSSQKGFPFQALLILAFLGAAGYFAWSVGSVQITGVWQEILLLF
jgi:hypothetical protein